MLQHSHDEQLAMPLLRSFADTSQQCAFPHASPVVCLTYAVLCVPVQAGRKAVSHPDISTAAVAPFTQPSLFLQFDRDAAGCISLSMLLHYISLHTSALRLVSWDAWSSTAAAAVALSACCCICRSRPATLQRCSTNASLQAVAHGCVNGTATAAALCLMYGCSVVACRHKRITCPMLPLHCTCCCSGCSCQCLMRVIGAPCSCRSCNASWRLWCQLRPCCKTWRCA